MRILTNYVGNSTTEKETKPTKKKTKKKKKKQKKKIVLVIRRRGKNKVACPPGIPVIERIILRRVYGQSRARSTHPSLGRKKITYGCESI